MHRTWVGLARSTGKHASAMRHNHIMAQLWSSCGLKVSTCKGGGPSPAWRVKRKRMAPPMPASRGEVNHEMIITLTPCEQRIRS